MIQLQADVKVPFSLLGRASAEACRKAYLEILARPADAWTEAQLDAWLTGPYRLVTQCAPTSVVRAPWEVPDYENVVPLRAATDVRAVLGFARWFVVGVLRAAWDGGQESSTFVGNALATGRVQAVDQGESVTLYLPVDLDGMRLADRILSLVAADWLARPLDYKDRLALCWSCNGVTFEECACAAPASGTRSIAAPPRLAKTGTR